MRAIWGHFALFSLLVAQVASAVGGSDGPTPWHLLFTMQCFVGGGPEAQIPVEKTDAGALFAPDARTLAQECAFVAHQRYGERGQSAVFDRRLLLTQRKVVGECWVGPCDTDELVLAATFAGLSSYPLRLACLRLAGEQFGEGARGELRNVRLGP